LGCGSTLCPLPQDGPLFWSDFRNGQSTSSQHGTLLAILDVTATQLYVMN
jgi:hypothetical protein